jgi:hypothetical protein
VVGVILFLDYPSRDPRLASGFQVVNSFCRRSGDRIARWEVVLGFSNPGNGLIKVFAVMANVVARIGRSLFSPGDSPKLLLEHATEVCQFQRTIPFPLEVFKLSSLKLLSLRCWREISFAYFKFRFIRNVRKADPA